MTAERTLVPTGIEGLDNILNGGFPADRVYLIQGDPGVGKTTIALQLLLAGAARGEPVLYVTLSETRDEINGVAQSHGWSLDPIHIYEMANADPGDEPDNENTLYMPAEVELGERMRSLLETIDRIKPRRVIIDSCSELRLLAGTPLRFRRQILALKRDLVKRNCTMWLLENPLTQGGDVLLQSLVHGVIALEQLAPLYGSERRRLRVLKLREVRYRGGYHDFLIQTGGVRVYPRLVAAEHVSASGRDSIPSGVSGLDALLGGGIDRGTSTLLLGPAGSGKSAMATAFAMAEAQRGESSALFAFDESIDTLFARAEALGMPLRAHVDSGRVILRAVDPAELSPGEFVHAVRRAVEEKGARVVIIDSLNGYFNAMVDEKFVLAQMHELLTYLGHRGVATILVMAQHGMVGTMAAPIDVSYLADTVVLLRFFEAQGRVRKAVSALKKRSGHHEDAIREYLITPSGLMVGPPLRDFRGVLTGVPDYDSQLPDLRADEEPRD
jgi:circadian clock protein KaiC